VRVVLDTNVLLAGLATHGLCEALLKIVYRDHTVILSEHILDEVSRHFSGKFKATKAQTESVVGFLRSSSEIAEPAAVPRGTLRDKDDLPVLGTAVAGDASCLVTGDQELLALGRFQGVDILSPRALGARASTARRQGSRRGSRAWRQSAERVRRSAGCRPPASAGWNGRSRFHC